MLSLIRAFAKSPIAMALILVPIILAFALFGVTGIFTGSGTAIVIVGSEQVSQRELAREYDFAFRQRQREDINYTREQAQADGLGDSILNRMIMDSALNSKSGELNLAISDETLFDIISVFPEFRNPATGVFDIDTARGLLAQNNQTLDEFLANLRSEMRRRQFTLSLSTGIDAPHDMAATHYLYGEERRQMRMLIIDASTADAIADPTEEQLQDFLDSNRGATDSIGFPQYVALERRAFSLVRFRLQDFVLDVDVDEEVLRELYEYEVETAQIGTPARRGFTQIIATDEATANAAAARLAAGETPADIAADMGLGETITLEDVESYEVPDTQLADAVFALPIGSASAVEGTFGWSAVQITLAIDATLPTYEERLPDMRAAAARDQALNDMYDAMALFEGARNDGANLAIAAETAGIPLEMFQSLDQYARDESRQLDYGRYADLGEDVLGRAFESFLGFTSELEQYNESDFFILRVDEIIEERPLELDEVRELAEAGWREIQVDTQLDARANDALTQLQAGEDMDFVAILAGGRVEAATLKRDETAGAFIGPVVSQAFAQDAADFAIAFGTPPLQKIIIVVDEIIAADLAAADPAVLVSFETATSREIVNDIDAALQAALILEYDIANAPIDARLRAAALGERDPTQ
jgi:peptidyl-prolyl cis-trans isomerase D